MAALGPNLVRMFLRSFSVPYTAVSVPNFTNFYQTVLWDATDTIAGRIIRKYNPYNYNRVPVPLELLLLLC